MKGRQPNVRRCGACARNLMRATGAAWPVARILAAGATADPWLAGKIKGWEGILTKEYAVAFRRADWGHSRLDAEISKLAVLRNPVPAAMPTADDLFFAPEQYTITKSIYENV